MKKLLFSFAGFFLLCPPQLDHFFRGKIGFPSSEKPFVILIPSYNNEKYCLGNIKSALKQNYKNYRIIFINDCSTDKTLEIVKKYSYKKKLQIIDNPKRELALANYYNTIHQHVRDEEIIISLDGDDRLAHPEVLNHLNRIYSQSKQQIWLTYGQFVEERSQRKGFAAPIPKNVIGANKFRSYAHLPTHLRTFYAWLFKQIDVKDLQRDGEFYTMSWDTACMLPMIEMASLNHFAFIPDILYIYNDKNPISDHRIDQDLQFAINREIRQKPAYQPL